jgi:hypothetical protein
MTGCHCEMAGHPASGFARGFVGCDECGTACCRSCGLEIGTGTYCRWCATSLAPAGGR